MKVTKIAENFYMATSVVVSIFAEFPFFVV